MVPFHVIPTRVHVLGLAYPGLNGLLEGAYLLLRWIQFLFPRFDCGVEVLLEQVVVYENRVGDRGELLDEIQDVLALHLGAVVDAQDVV